MRTYSKIFEIIDLNQISHSPLSLSYKLIKFILNFAINNKKNTNGKINTYYINKDLKNIKLKKYNFIAFKSQDLMNWKKVIKYDDMPTGHPEGMIFITKKNQMNWLN